MTREHVRAGNMRSDNEAMHVGGQLMRVLSPTPSPLHPCPARSKTQTRVWRATSPCTHAQLGVRSPSPLNRITVGEPEPKQRR